MGGGPVGHLGRLQPFDEVAADVEGAGCSGAQEPFVAGEGAKIASHLPNVHRHLAHGLGGVQQHVGSLIVSQAADLRYGQELAAGVGQMRENDELRGGRQRRLKGGEDFRVAVACRQADYLCRHAVPFAAVVEGYDYGGVLETAGYHFVAGHKAEAADHDVNPFRGVLLEGDLLRGGIDEVCQGASGAPAHRQPLLADRGRSGRLRFHQESLLDSGDHGAGARPLPARVEVGQRGCCRYFGAD